MIVFGNRVLCFIVLFLLHSAGSMAMAEEEPLISVVIREHMGASFLTNNPSYFTYDKNQQHCKEKGGYLHSAYTKAIRAEVMKEFEKLHYGVDISFYIGADMEYSVHKEPDPDKRCYYAVPSLNCIIKWNQGLWENALGDGSGVGFYKGDPKKVSGSGLINGYDVTVESSWISTQRPYIMNHNPSLEGFSFVVYNNVKGYKFFTRNRIVCACEAQDYIIKRAEAPTTPTDAPKPTSEAPTTPTDAPTAPTEAPTAPTEAPTVPTEAPTVPTEAPTTATNTSQSAGSEVSGAPDESDGKSGWSSGLTALVVVLPILFVILVVVLCLYFCGYICRPKADGRRVTGDSTATIRTDRKRSVKRERTENPNMATASDNEMNPLGGEAGQRRRRRRTISRNTWIETPQQADAMVRTDGAVPSDSDAAAEQQTRRTRPTRRARSKVRALHMSAVEVPIAGEIVEDTVGEWH